MIKDIIEYVAENSASNKTLYQTIKVIKAKSSDANIINSLKDVETSIAISVRRNRLLLEKLKGGLEDYNQQFAEEFILLYESFNDNFLVLNKLKGGYQVLLTSKDGGIIASKTFISQIEAIEYYIELYKNE